MRLTIVALITTLTAALPLWAQPVKALPPQPTKPDPTQPLRQFIARPDGWSWKNLGRNANRTLIQLNAGNWKGTSWKHQLAIYEPKQNRHPDAAVLLLSTKNIPTDMLGGQLAANSCGTRFVFAYDVPNQPLWGRTENDLLGYSVQQTVATNDPTWSLAFPMARSAIRSMDAVDAWSRQQNHPIKRWIVIGFSKRALAGWLASTDPRVKGLVSIGYNNLNLEEQAKRQKAQWGALSIHWQKMVPPVVQQELDTAHGANLLATWDPWSFRQQMNKPRLLIDATNGDYWTLDSLQLFKNALPGRTDTLFFPNVGHFMENAIVSLFGSAATWVEYTLDGQRPPKITLTSQTGPKPTLQLQAPGATAQQLYFASSPTRDFRKANWQQVTLPAGKPRAFPCVSASNRVLAVFGSASWHQGIHTLQLTSDIHFFVRDARGQWRPAP